jgi:hypothetical protein
LASDFFSDPRWSIAAAAMTPRASETAFSPASFPAVILVVVIAYFLSIVAIVSRGSF